MAMLVKRVALRQVAATGVGTLLCAMYLGAAGAQALAFGGAVAAANTLLLAWHIGRAVRKPRNEPGRELAKLVRSNLERFFLVALLLAAGLGWLKLNPAPLVVGFVLGQAILVVSTIISGIEKQ